MPPEILSIIPARSGSKGLKDKNIRNLNGKPLIAYTIEASLKSKFITRTIVSTDSPAYADISKGCGAEIPCLRPDNISGDDISSEAVLLHMLAYLEEIEGYKPDYLCLLQCTSPLRTNEHIDAAFEKLIGSGFDSVVGVCEANPHPYVCKYFEGDRLVYLFEEAKKSKQRQKFPPFYRVNGAIYIIKADVLLQTKNLAIDNMTGYIMSMESSLDIDNEFDFLQASLYI